MLPTSEITISEKFILGSTEHPCTACQIDDGNFFIAGAYMNQTIKVWDSSSGYPITEFSDTSPESCATNMRWKPKSPDGSYSHQLLTVTGTGWIKKYSGENGSILGEVDPVGPAESLDAVTYTPGGDYFVVGGTDKIPRMYDDELMKEIVQLDGLNTDHSQHGNRIFTLKFNPEDPNMLVSGGWDNNIFIYDVRKKGPVGVMLGPHVCGDSIDFWDEYTLISGAFKTDNQICQWDLRK